MLVPLASLPAYLALGWTFIYECAGGMRVDGPACVVRWQKTGQPVYP